MQYFTVEVNANKPINNGEKDYSQEFKAFNQAGICAAIHYQENNKPGNMFVYPVMEKMVKAETGTGAIFKFQKWQREGLDQNYLSGISPNYL